MQFMRVEKVFGDNENFPHVFDKQMATIKLSAQTAERYLPHQLHPFIVSSITLK